MAKRIRGIFFDLGETLLDFGDVDVTALFTAGSKLAYEHLRSLGYELPPMDKYNRRQLRAVRWNYFVSHVTRREFNALTLIDKQNRAGGRVLSPEDLIELAWRWYRPLSEQATAEDGLIEMLGALRDDGLLLGLVSNTFIPAPALDRHLAQVGLLELLPVRVYSCDARFRKPSRRIFEIALQRGGLRAGEVLFVGDSPRADIRGANRAGLISVLKDPTGRHDRSRIKPAHRIRKITELGRIVAAYNG